MMNMSFLQDTQASYQREETLQYLNRFLEVNGSKTISSLPLKSWFELSKNLNTCMVDYKILFTASLDVFPENFSDVSQQIFVSNSTEKVTSDKNIKPLAMLSTIAKFYQKSESWQHRRQLLSMLSLFMTYQEVLQLIPDFTELKYYTSKKHGEKFGYGLPVPLAEIHRQKMDSFLEFITSPHIIRNLPYDAGITIGGQQITEEAHGKLNAGITIGGQHITEEAHGKLNAGITIGTTDNDHWTTDNRRSPLKVEHGKRTTDNRRSPLKVDARGQQITEGPLKMQGSPLGGQQITEEAHGDRDAGITIGGKRDEEDNRRSPLKDERGMKEDNRSPLKDEGGMKEDNRRSPLKDEGGMKEDNRKSSPLKDEGRMKEDNRRSPLKDEGRMKEDNRRSPLKDEGRMKEDNRRSPLKDEGGMKEDNRRSPLKDEGRMKEDNRRSPLKDEGRMKEDNRRSPLKDEGGMKEDNRRSPLKDEGRMKEDNRRSPLKDEGRMKEDNRRSPLKDEGGMKEDNRRSPLKDEYIFL
ncbi:unnamed protein product [Mytilus edulis]|uniref:Uncharacterized protein n=1 Tax=Mytilus edulis TaxID=6550 RepID=A0A8S3T3M0_MYTED|nr:unnamed protein product [Mytilus edulis]